jgi:predicted fused transcriptional regulator/phosphomethylpyrimidine kinase
MNEGLEYYIRRGVKANDVYSDLVGDVETFVNVEHSTNAIRFKLDEKSELQHMFLTEEQIQDILKIMEYVYEAGKRGKEKYVFWSEME